MKENKFTFKSTLPATLFSSSLSSCSEKVANCESETRPVGFFVELDLPGLRVVDCPGFLVPTTEDHGLGDVVVVLAVFVLSEVLGAVVGLGVDGLLLAELLGQRRDPRIFFACPQSISLFWTEVPRSLLSRLTLTAHHVWPFFVFKQVSWDEPPLF